MIFFVKSLASPAGPPSCASRASHASRERQAGLQDL
jgi:hypothetical protein